MDIPPCSITRVMTRRLTACTRLWFVVHVVGTAYQPLYCSYMQSTRMKNDARTSKILPQPQITVAYALHASGVTSSFWLGIGTIRNVAVPDTTGQLCGQTEGTGQLCGQTEGTGQLCGQTEGTRGRYWWRSPVDLGAVFNEELYEPDFVVFERPREPLVQRLAFVPSSPLGVSQPFTHSVCT